MAHFLYTLIIYPLYTLIECIFTFFNAFFDVEGIAVIMVSVAVTVLCLPLYAVAEHWQEVERLKQESMKAQLSRIKRAFKGDERYMMTTAYYRECGYSPIMALRSSFGLLIQIPFFIAAYHFLSGLDTIRGVPFLFIRDMGKSDALFKIGNFSVNVLPIAMTLINCASGVVYSKGHGAREKVQIFGMAAIFLVLLYNSPAGLVLYWTFNNIFSLVKNIFYKMKKPLKAFYTCVCAAAAVTIIYIAFFSTFVIQFKLVGISACLLVFLLAPLCRGIARLLESGGPLSEAVQNKRIRNTLYILSCLLLCVFSGWTIPSMLISSSPVEFADIGGHSSALYYILNTMLQSCGIFIFWAFCVYFLFGAQIQAAAAIVMTFLSYAAVLNAFVFMLPYGDIAATLVFLNQASFRTISLPSLLNLLALLALAAAVLALIVRKKIRVLTGLSTIMLASLTLLCVVNTLTISREYREYAASKGKSDAAETVTPIIHLSRNKPNVILIMLDKATCQYVGEIVKEDPTIAEAFSGFTLYKNVLSFNGHTLQGAPALFGGYGYTPEAINARADVSFLEDVNRSQLVLPRIFSEEAGYSATVIEPTWINGAHYCDLSFLSPYPKISGHQGKGAYTTLWFKTRNKTGVTDSTKIFLERNLLFFSFFRESPIFLREIVYKKSYWYSGEQVQDSAELIDNYSFLDFLPELTDFSETEGGTYTSFLNELTHGNAFLQAPDYVPVNKVTDTGSSRYKGDGSYHMQMAAFKMLARWIEELKEQGVYDSTRIVISSDHGGTGTEDYFESDSDLDNRVHGTSYRGRGHYHPLFMVKDFNASGPLTEDDSAFMTNADAASILLKGIVRDPKDPFYGEKIPLDTAAIKTNGVRISVSDLHQPAYHKNPNKFTIKDGEWWLVKDPIKDSASWSQAYIEN